MSGRTIYLTEAELDAIVSARYEVIANYEGADDKEYIAFWDKRLPLLSSIRNKFYNIKKEKEK